MTYLVTSENEFNRVAAPNLPLSPMIPDRPYMEQLNNVLRLYFNQLNNTLSQLNTTNGISTIRFPYGAFSRNTQQSAAVINTAYAVAFDTTDFSNDVTLVSTTQITATNSGVYNFQFSVQLENTANASSDVTFWVKQNGTNINASGGLFGMSPRKSALDYFHLIGGYNVFVSLTAGQYIELYWSTTDTASSIQNYAASGVAPNNIPSSPAVIATMSFVSSL